MEKVMSHLIAKVVSSPGHAQTRSRLILALRGSGAAAFSLLADRALAA